MSDLYAKVLTKNDIGETGGHQAGITVPKADKELLNFFPLLNQDEFNPDLWLICIDPDGVEWKMRYIYYNGKTFSPPKSTRNEYRITHMTKFFSKWGANSGDSVLFSKATKDNHYHISVKHNSSEQNLSKNEGNKTIKLRGWSRVY